MTEYILTSGVLVDVHGPPTLASDAKYEIFRQPYNEPKLCLHELKYVADSPAIAAAALAKIKQQDLYSDAYSLTRALEKKPETVLAGDIYPAKYYLRRQKEPIYVILRSWKRYCGIALDYVTETAKETHYNYDVAIAALEATRQQIERHHLKISVELKLLSGVKFPHEVEVPRVNKTPMSVACFRALCNEIRNRGIDIIVDESNGTIMMPRTLSREALAELSEFSDRFVREYENNENAELDRGVEELRNRIENNPRVNMQDATENEFQELINHIRDVGVPFIVSVISDDGVEAMRRILPTDTATDEEREVLNRILYVFSRGCIGAIRSITELATSSGNRIRRNAANSACNTGSTVSSDTVTTTLTPTTLLTPPESLTTTFTVDLSPINFDYVIDLSLIRLRQHLPGNIRANITTGANASVNMHSGTSREIRDIVERMRRMCAYEEGQAFLRRERENFSDLECAITLTGIDASVTQNNNSIIVTMHGSRRDMVKLLISNYDSRRVTAFINPRTLEPTARLSLRDGRVDDPDHQVSFDDLVAEIRRAGIPIEITGSPAGAMISPRHDATLEQQRHLDRIMKAFNGCSVMSIGNMREVPHSVGDTNGTNNTNTTNTNNNTTTVVSGDLSERYQHVARLVSQRVFKKLCDRVRELGIDIRIEDGDVGELPRIMMPMGVSKEMKARIDSIRAKLVQEELTRIARCEREEYIDMLDRIRAAGINIRTDNADGCINIILIGDVAQEQIEFVERLKNAYMRRHETGFEEIEPEGVAVPENLASRLAALLSGVSSGRKKY